jgi:hypothetical protein
MMYRCGVYCAANACIEQVIQHGEVDVFQAVKTVRRHRPQLVENLVRKPVLEQGFLLFKRNGFLKLILLLCVLIIILSRLFLFYFNYIIISSKYIILFAFAYKLVCYCTLLYVLCFNLTYSGLFPWSSFRTTYVAWWL